MAIYNPNFYLVIIGTEILNGRREDKHFVFVRDELLKRGWKLYASFIIEDDPKLIENVFKLIKSDSKSVMFSFGGIGATPDDYTREIASKVFTDSEPEINLDAKKLIIEQFGKDAYPHRINMAKIPKNSKLLPNPVNRVPGFYLDERFFFVPGFPQMSHYMVKYALDKFYPQSSKETRYTICIEASENDLMDIMKKIPKEVEFSSLPSIENGRYKDVISIASKDPKTAKKWFNFFKLEVQKRGFKFYEDKNCI